MFIGRHLGKSPVQPTSQSRISCEVKAGYSGLYPVWPLKPPRMEAAQCLWATSFTSFLMVKTGVWGLFFLLSSLNLSLQLVPVVLHLSALCFCEDQDSVFLVISFTAWKVAVRFLFTSLLPDHLAVPPIFDSKMPGACLRMGFRQMIL